MEQPFSSSLESKLKHAFKDRGLMALVVTRRAAMEEGLVPTIKHEKGWSFSRLKFLGTRVLRLLTSDYLFKTLKTEGHLTVAHAAILSYNGKTTGVARHINLSEALILGNGEKLQKINQNDKVLFEHMQVLFGALWIDLEANYLAVQKIFYHIYEYSDSIITPSPAVQIPEKLIDLNKLDEFQTKLGYRFEQRHLLLQALLRRATLEEKLVPGEICFQTLEFLGDKIMGCIVAEQLLRQYPKANSETLNPIYDHVVSNSALLPGIAAALNIGEVLILGRSERFFGVATNTRKLVDHVEAIFGAVWLENFPDYEKAKAIILPLFTRKTPPKTSDSPTPTMTKL